MAALWAAMFRSAGLDADMDEEMRFHVEMHATRLMRERGLDQREARRQAFVAFGGVEKFKEEGRDGRGVRWLDAIRLDSRLAVRMLRKYPALTLIGGFAMAVAIAVGAMAFEVVSEALTTSIPIEEGGRVVSIQFATDAQGRPERRVLRDFAEWRHGLTTLRELGAFRNASHNLSVDGGHPDAIRVAEMTASGFGVARTPPLLGRYLQPHDEAAGAAPVLVIGHDAWQARFAGDATIVGRTVSLGGVAHTIVGVMPGGFQFPIDHQFWKPLPVNGVEHDRLQGPEVMVFGRLAPDATLAQARAELAAVGQRTATAYPDLYGRLRLVAMPFSREHVDVDRPEIEWALRVFQLLIGALLVIVAANLAILMYARTVTRLGEIAVRSALGASRARLLAQLFIEALALSLAGAAAGLLMADTGLAWVGAALARSGGHIPFWMTFEISAGTVLYAVALAVVAAVIVGVLPGLRTTGGETSTNLRALSGGTGRPLGWLWTSLIVTQVAMAAAILPLALYLVGEVARMEWSSPGFAAGEFLIAKVDAVDRQEEIVTRLERESAIADVTFSSNVPGVEGSRYIRFEDARQAENRTFEVNTLDGDVGLFKVYDARILAGRDFNAGDIGSGNVIVNRTFANELSPDTSVLGRPLTFVAPAGQDGSQARIYQIVGIVDDFPAFPPPPGSSGTRTLYRPSRLGGDRAILTIRYRTAITADAIARLRQVVAEVDPAAPLRDVTLLTEFYRDNRALWRLISTGLTLITVSVLLLSAAGIYALMSFTVAQRTREIGIRSALGANPRRLLAGIFGRVLAQLSIGLAIGSLLSGTVIGLSLEITQATALFGAVAVVILIVGIAAAIGPARRGLRINPTEALRTDA